MTPDTVEGYRGAFKHAPIGRWHQASGTLDAVMDEIWEFRPDLTLRIILAGPFKHPREEQHFEWRESGIERRILLREADTDPGSTGHEQPAEWIEIDYDFRLVDTDVGQVIAMFQTGTPFEGFFLSSKPLSYFGDIDEKTDEAGETS